MDDDKNSSEDQEKPKIDPTLMDHLEKGGKIGKSKEAKSDSE